MLAFSRILTFRLKLEFRTTFEVNGRWLTFVLNGLDPRRFCEHWLHHLTWLVEYLVRFFLKPPFLIFMML